MRCSEKICCHKVEYMAKKIGNSAFRNAFNFGLGAGLGAGLSTMLYIFIGMLFFIPGVVLLSQERKKPKDKQNSSMVILAFVLMAIGSIVGLGMGAGFLFSSIMEE